MTRILTIAALVASLGCIDQPRAHKYPIDATPGYDRPVSKKTLAESPVVEITGEHFVPDLVIVKLGQTVVWKNVTPTLHSIVVDEQSARGTIVAGEKGLRSGELMPGDSYEFTFNQLGTYAYTCWHHKDEGRGGTIEVK